MFTLKKWLWTQWQKFRGADRAYANYLAHFAHYQTQVVNPELQQSLNIQPMSKAAFLKAWQQQGLTPAAKSCGCKTGGCH
ncbi:hypothetical protein [Methylophilus medardicus]|uniref:Uncharacterized protein n=1 Tax=Methylophilus medardicus TaxID=2588534 RepID=A0A5B8CPR0_9PROT|nr:hypothetical protein [Methylophilus medardicus]QDC43231.1 hypothetical protein FIU01_00955 [Methylophilus medardicus]QDC48238.1 hypothetical protein FIU00_00955 [Methylophilus medardicus]QDC51943.1 hypothetical protein FIT99_00955 [Methylophilus medardicus]